MAGKMSHLIFDAFFQVGLSWTAGTLGINYVISLNPLSMATALMVKNNGRKDMTITSALFSNVKFKKRGGTAVQGLGGCLYCTHPPLSSFELLSPSEAMQSQPGGWFGFHSEEKHGVIWKWKQTDVPLNILKQKLISLMKNIFL
ncbi:hypothetical protein SLEP1_g43167 [Rubroshorea leprosula]|uniref:Uncharacterized protein n=1 Tax=Rubroshorea leprosula TaxID=152421 RepID=A0AAV5LD56_9ROSI|nr:hypothetical protein SLEP1_g43167 [Rubroshorea leprosula]